MVAPSDSGPSLVVISDAGRTRQIPIPSSGIVLGRDTQLGPPFTTDQYVSRNHVSVQRRGDGVEIADLGSANGTYVNGTRVHAQARLQDRDVLRIGQIELRLAVPEETVTAGDRGAHGGGAHAGGVGAAEVYTAGVRAGGDGPCLAIVAPDAFSGRRFRLAGYDLVVGRDPASGICLDDPHISWTHAALRRHGDAVYVQDLGSTSGTFVNGQALTAVRELRPGDIVTFAGISARLG